MRGTGRVLLSLSLTSSSTTRLAFPLLFPTKTFPLHKSLFPFLKPPARSRVLVRFRPLCSATTIAAAAESVQTLEPIKHSIILERLRVRHLKDSAKAPANASHVQPRKPKTESLGNKSGSEVSERGKRKKNAALASSFEGLGLSEEVMGALKEMNISVPTEIQCIGIPAVLEGKM